MAQLVEDHGKQLGTQLSEFHKTTALEKEKVEKKHKTEMEAAQKLAQVACLLELANPEPLTQTPGPGTRRPAP